MENLGVNQVRSREPVLWRRRLRVSKLKIFRCQRKKGPKPLKVSALCHKSRAKCPCSTIRRENQAFLNEFGRTLDNGGVEAQNPSFFAARRRKSTVALKRAPCPACCVYLSPSHRSLFASSGHPGLICFRRTFANSRLPNEPSGSSRASASRTGASCTPSANCALSPTAKRLAIRALGKR